MDIASNIRTIDDVILLPTMTYVTHGTMVHVLAFYVKLSVCNGFYVPCVRTMI